MTLTYGFLKCRLSGALSLKASRRRREIQYHLHANAEASGQRWDVAINVGTNDSDDLLNYRIVHDFHHALRDTLNARADGFHDLTGTDSLPALDFVRSDVLMETGPWRRSEPMDGSDVVEPVASLRRLLGRAIDSAAPVYLFGRTYRTGGPGIHDVHMNQGSGGGFLNDGVHDDNDHNDVWQDGAVLVDLGDAGWSAFFTAFTQQSLPTDDLGNPALDGKTLG